jgi:hypothetical protein
MKQSISYKGKPFNVKVDYLLRPECVCCKKKGFLYLHHLKYAYTVKEVRANPLLALDNTICVCYKCHEVANAMRKLLEADDQVVTRLIELIRLKTYYN